MTGETRETVAAALELIDDGDRRTAAARVATLPPDRLDRVHDAVSTLLDVINDVRHRRSEETKRS